MVSYRFVTHNTQQFRGLTTDELVMNINELVTRPANKSHLDMK